MQLSHAIVTITPPRIRFRRELTPRGFEGNSCTSVRMRREPYTASYCMHARELLQRRGY